MLGKLLKNYITGEIYTVIQDDGYLLKLLRVDGNEIYYVIKENLRPLFILDGKELEEFEHNLVMEELV